MTHTLPAPPGTRSPNVRVHAAARRLVMCGLLLGLLPCAALGQGKMPPADGRSNPPMPTDLLSVAAHPDNPGNVNTPEPGRDPVCRHPGTHPGYESDQEEFRFTLPTTRYIGPVQGGFSGADAWRNGTLVNAREMVAAGTLGNTVRVEIEFYLHVNQCSLIPFPNLEIEFNGQSVAAVLATTPTYAGEEPQPGTGEPGGGAASNGGEKRQSVLVTRAQWTKDHWQKAVLFVPVDMVRFPAAKGENGSRPTAVNNTLTIKWDVRGPHTDCYCLNVNWASMKVRAMAPVVLMHGINQTEAWWTAHGFKPALDMAMIPNVALDLNRIANTDTFNGEDIGRVGRLLPDEFMKVYANYGTSTVHIVAHSMGGLHIRNMLATRWRDLEKKAVDLGANMQALAPPLSPVASFHTLSTPHNGSVLADAMWTKALLDRVGAEKIIWVNDVDPLIALAVRFHEVVPGYRSLQTSECALLNNQHFSAALGLGTPGPSALPPAGLVRYEMHGADMDRNFDNNITTGANALSLDPGPDEVSPLQLDEPALDWGTSIAPAAADSVMTSIYRQLQGTRAITTEPATIAGEDGKPHQVISAFQVRQQPSEPLGNDSLVTIESAWGVPMATPAIEPLTHVWRWANAGQRPAKNHSSIGDGQVALVVVGQLKGADLERGGMR